MLGLLLFCAVLSVGVSQSQGETVYLTTLGGLAFHKVRVAGEMTNANVKATCEGLGMRYPCNFRGGDRCSNSQFYSSDCVAFDTVSTNCATFNVIAYEVCPGTVNSYNCALLDDVFLYRRYWTSGDGAYGLDHQTTSYVSGAGQFDLWALCTDVDECSSSPCLGGGTCVDQIGSYTCDCPKGTAGDRCEAVVDGGSCYKFFSTPATHFAAEKACRAEGGHLAVAKDVGKQRFLSGHIPAGNSDSHWIGTKVTSDKLIFSDQPSVFNEIAGLDWAEDSPGLPCALCVLMDNADSHRAKTTSCMEQHSYICQSETTSCDQNVCMHGGNCSSCFGGNRHRLRMPRWVRRKVLREPRSHTVVRSGIMPVRLDLRRSADALSLHRARHKDWLSLSVQQRLLSKRHVLQGGGPGVFLLLVSLGARHSQPDTTEP